MKKNANGNMLAEDPLAFGISHNHKYSHEFTYLFALVMANFSKKAAIAVATLGVIYLWGRGRGQSNK